MTTIIQRRVWVSNCNKCVTVSFSRIGTTLSRIVYFSPYVIPRRTNLLTTRRSPDNKGNTSCYFPLLFDCSMLFNIMLRIGNDYRRCCNLELSCFGQSCVQVACLTCTGSCTTLVENTSITVPNIHVCPCACSQYLNTVVYSPVRHSKYWRVS